jgi:transposase InsO family protein
VAFGVECAVSRTGSCCDDEAMERYIGSLKYEWTKHENFENLAAIGLSVFTYIKAFYNAEEVPGTVSYKCLKQLEAEVVAA